MYYFLRCNFSKNVYGNLIIVELIHFWLLELIEKK